MPPISPKELVVLRKDLMQAEINPWRYERFAYLGMCLACLSVSLVAMVIYLKNGDFNLTALSLGGAGGVLGVSVASLLTFVQRTRETVDKLMCMYMGAAETDKSSVEE